MNVHVSTKIHIARSAGVLGGFTMLSRILGFIRDILIARYFGTSAAAEAFVVSFKLPNLFRDLLGEGAMNSAIVPVLAEVEKKHGQARMKVLAGSLICVFIVLLIIISVIGVCLAPWMVRLLAPGFVNGSEAYELTVKLTRILFPFVALIGFAALLMGILNAQKIFAPSAAGPALLNISMIFALCFVVPSRGIQYLAYFILLGGAAQILIQIPYVLKAGVISFQKIIDPALHKIFKLLIPRIWGTAIYQTSVFVDTILASFVSIVGAGGQSALYFSSRLFQLPLSVFGVAIAQAALPTLAAHHADENETEFTRSLNFAVKIVFYLVFPAAVGLAVFSHPIIRILLKRGEFGDYSAGITSSALFFYALGLPACGLIKILVSAFYALHDTRTPVKTASVSLIVNVGCNLALMHWLKIGGLALATSFAATFNAVLLYRALSKRLKTLDFRDLLPSFWNAVISCMAMAAAAVLILKTFLNDQDAHPLHSVPVLLISIGVCAAVYAVTVLLLGKEDVRNVLKRFRKRGKIES